MACTLIIVKATKHEEECHILNLLSLLLLLLLLLILLQIKIVSYIKFIKNNHINLFIINN